MFYEGSRSKSQADIIAGINTSLLSSHDGYLLSQYTNIHTFIQILRLANIHIFTYIPILHTYASIPGNLQLSIQTCIHAVMYMNVQTDR